MLKNTTKNTILTRRTEFCYSFLSKATGLMFHHKLKDNAFVFVFKKEKFISLHMFFVFFPIDIIFLDKDKKVVEIKENFKPFTMYFPKRKAKYIIELPKNTIKKSNTEVRDKLLF